MKILFTTTLLLASLSSFAQCPKLTGEYNCLDLLNKGAPATSISISQSESENGITTYVTQVPGGIKTIIADGLRREFYFDREKSSKEPSLTKMAKVTCSDGKIKIDYSDIADTFPGSYIHEYMSFKNGVLSIYIESLVPTGAKKVTYKSSCLQK